VGKVKYVLDACALLAFLNREDGWEKVKDLLFQASDATGVQIYMNAVNLLEVYYDRLRLSDSIKIDEFLSHAFASPIQIIDTISRPVLDEAARIKTVYRRLSLADAIGLATASCMKGIFTTSDHHELEIVAHNDRIDFLWIR
jgi:PIN domain nuclease of toxin-antitoxin system